MRISDWSSGVCSSHLLTRVRSGPTCVRPLADWGADVVKVEMPVTDDACQLGGPRSGSDFQNLHRNNRSLTLDMKKPDGLEEFGRASSREACVRPSRSRRAPYNSQKKLLLYNTC